MMNNSVSDSLLYTYQRPEDVRNFWSICRVRYTKLLALKTVRLSHEVRFGKNLAFSNVWYLSVV